MMITTMPPAIVSFADITPHSYAYLITEDKLKVIRGLANRRGWSGPVREILFHNQAGIRGVFFGEIMRRARTMKMTEQVGELVREVIFSLVEAL